MQKICWHLCKEVMGRRSSQIFTDKYGFNLGIQGFRDSGI
ncbi:hypothetical protein D1AOALGA4SA_10606 [Olavius algarvensis Delta 1 endosymbiont]|nr:hypothetical protein D1AOALGA4SA_10606 [Olavius algarvensis Delta 1 endosymbiont]